MVISTFARFPKPLNQSVSLCLIALLSIITLRWLQLPQLNQLKRGSQDTSTAELQQEIEAEKVRLNLLQKFPTFGFNNLLADWVFLNFLQYFGDDEVRAKTGYQLSPDYFEVIIDRDPKFLQAYFFLSGSTSIYAGIPQRSVALMEKGLQFLRPKAPPQSYYVWRYKGIDELLFLGEGKAAQHSFEMAAEWASYYNDAESQSVAAISRRTAQFLERKPDSRIAQANAWSLVLSNAIKSNDKGSAQLAINRIEALGGQVSISEEGAVKVFLPKED